MQAIASNIGTSNLRYGPYLQGISYAAYGKIHSVIFHCIDSRTYKPKLSLQQNRREINAFLDMNSDHFRVYLCLDLYNW